MNWDDGILVGVIARTHGNRGEVIVNPETDFPEERFRKGAQLWTRRRENAPVAIEVVSMRMHQGRPVILFSGIGSMNDAELLANQELRTDEAADELLPDGEFFHRDLIGCEVVTEGGELVGRVINVLDDSAQARLVVAGKRSELLIPLADEICTVDVAAKRITVRPPDGLLELNGDWR
jgi:16S rRNA processing protein RimM